MKIYFVITLQNGIELSVILKKKGIELPNVSN